MIGCEIQVDSYDEYQRKRDNPAARDPLHPPTRKHLTWLYFLTGNCVGARAPISSASAASTKRSPATVTRISSSAIVCSTPGVAIDYAPEAVNYHWHPVPFDEQQGRMELAGRSTVRFFRKHPTFDVRLRLGMTPLSLGAARRSSTALPALRRWIDDGAQAPGFAAHALVPISLPHRYQGGIT